MKETEMILQMAHENNGTVTTAMVTKAGISRGNLKYLTDTGKLERTMKSLLFRIGLSEAFFPVILPYSYGI